jgi:hypothetical protein
MEFLYEKNTQNFYSIESHCLVSLLFSHHDHCIKTAKMDERMNQRYIIDKIVFSNACIYMNELVIIAV